MRAIRVTGPNEIELADVSPPSDPTLHTIAVERVGICGTDVKVFHGHIPVAYPRIAGHEMVGRVVSAPPGSPYPEGTRVMVDPGVACGWCDLCQAGRTNLCRNGGLLGREVDGVFTELIQAPTARIVGVPDHLDPRSAGLVQVLGTCVHAVKHLTPFPGRVAAVIGLGVTGQIISQLLTLSGMDVVGVTRSEWKRQLALDTGGVVRAVAPDDAEQVLADMTDGRGPAIVVEAVGTEATLARAVELVGIGGEVLAYGTITGGSTGLPYYQLYLKELTIHNPRAAVTRDYAEGADLAASGKLSLAPLVSHELGLDEAGRAFDLVDEAMKVLMAV